MIDDLLLLWHQYRIVIITSSGFLVTALQIWLYFQSKKQSSQQLPPETRDKIDQDALGKSEISDLIKRTASSRALPRSSTTQATTLRSPKRIQGSKSFKRATTKHPNLTAKAIQPTIFFSSLAGSTKTRAFEFSNALDAFAESNRSSHTIEILPSEVVDLAYIEYDDYFTTLPQHKENTANFYVILVPTYNVDTILTNFLEHLKETHHDFRVDTAPLRDILGYAVFGFGAKDEWPTEEEGFCLQAAEVDKWLARLTARKRAYPLGMGDVQSDALARLDEWRAGVQGVLFDLAAGKSLGIGVPGSGDAVESDEEGEDVEIKTFEASGTRLGQKRAQSALDDVENIGSALGPSDISRSLTVDFTTYKDNSVKQTGEVKEMVPKTSPTYAALTKQGYSIVGSHSGVKICRWTKSALRGRGSCYKFSFYGIKSHLCMETTPSLSCSNKCVFCWRHGTNPVGTTWRWQVDPPEEIFAGVKEGHYKKIKMLRGVPGVRAERFEEAMKIRHCALSLVGEPIFYPYINEFTALLHNERISSFLVCNAQHPDQLATLKPVTQLYVSIDASNRESLRKIDRPLHRDFWERFCRCLDILKAKRFRQRTVFRLTLVKGFNIEDEAEGYADLVERGLPCFIEVKGVTFCGTSTSAGVGLTMQNVPFYEEVTAFVQALSEALERRGLDYGIAAEHAHSCCVLLASNRFYKDGTWHTVIDYSKFFELLESGIDFAPEDYTAPTPSWALWGNGGFDPADERVYTRGKNRKSKSAGTVSLEI